MSWFLIRNSRGFHFGKLAQQLDYVHSYFIIVIQFLYFLTSTHTGGSISYNNKLFTFFFSDWKAFFQNDMRPIITYNLYANYWINLK